MKYLLILIVLMGDKEELVEVHTYTHRNECVQVAQQYMRADNVKGFVCKPVNET